MAPVLGGLIGAGIYKVFIEKYLPADEPVPQHVADEVIKKYA